jgi:hypothetical protein
MRTPTICWLPYGAGALQKRTGYWLLIYRDLEGRRIQENSGTNDYARARMLLAERVLERLDAMRGRIGASLEEARANIAAAEGGGAARRTRGPGRRGAADRSHAAGRGDQR